MTKKETKRAKILWKNVHDGDGLVYKKGMIIELQNDLFKRFDKLSKTIGENDVDAIKATDEGLTHEVVTIADKLSIVEV